MRESGVPLGQKLAQTRRWWRTTRLLGGLAWILCVVVALGLLCFHVDRHLPLSATAREGWRLGIGLAGLTTLLLMLLRPLLRPLPDKALAADVERRYPALGERLLTTIDLLPVLAMTEGATASGFSGPMVASLAEETQKAAADLDFRRAVSTRPLRVASLSAAFTLILLVLHVVFAPEAFAVWLQRMARPHDDIAPFAQTRVWLTPGVAVLPRGEALTVTVTTRGSATDKATLRYHLAGDDANSWKTVELTAPKPLTAQDEANTPTADSKKKEEGRKFTYRFPAVSQNIALVATANDGRSNERAVNVEDRPTLLNMKLALHFPTYMKRKDQILAESTGNIAAPVGTEVGVVGTANKPLQSAEFVGDGAKNGAWEVENDKTTGQISVRKDGAYRLNLTDRHGFDNPAAPRYEIRALKDQTPTVQITRPTTDVDLVPNGSLPVVSNATDDYGIESMHLVYATTHGEADSKQGIATTAHGTFALPGPDGKPTATAAFRWNIASAKAKPGDLLRFQVEATDNDTLSGPHTGRSQNYRVRVVSLLEMQKRLKEQLDEEARMLAQLRQRQIEAQKQLTQARQKPDNAALTKAQEAERAVSQETRALSQRLDQLSQQLENNSLATKSELQRRDQAQQTLQNLAQQKMPAAADSVQKAQTPQKGDPSKQDSLRKADQQESEAKQGIEKAQQLLSRTPTAQQLAEEAARLAQDQDRLAQASRSLDEDIRGERQASKSNALTKEQRENLEVVRRQQAEAARDSQQLQKQLERAAQEAAERGQKNEASALQKAADQMKNGNVAGNQQKAQNSLQKNQPSAAAPPQDKAAAALQKAAEAAKQAAQETNPDSAQAAAERLEQAAERLRQMAQQQKQIADQVAQNPNAQQSKALAQKEQAMQQAAQQMQQSLRNAQNAQQNLNQSQQNLNQSQQSLSQSQSQQAQSPSRNAQQQLERAAQQAQQAAQQMRQQQAANEMQEKVDRLAQVQRGLQKATQRLDTARKTQPLDANQRRELGQLAAKQEATEQQARELAGRMPSPAFQQALKMSADQMRPATRNLNRDPQPDTSQETQTAQERAAQTLETISQSLKQQAQAGGQQQGQQGQQGEQQGSPSPQQAQQAAALGELMLAQGLQKQLRKDTGALDQARQRNQNGQLTDPQKAEANRQASGQRTTQDIAKKAADSLSELPGVGDQVRGAAQQMGQAANQLFQQQTGQPTQQRQDDAIQRLDRAAKQAQQQMQQQQQQQQAQQQGQQGAPQPGGQQKGNQPNKAISRLEGVKRGQTGSPIDRSGHGFGGLNNRAQRTLREGQQERVPAEFQDLVSRYYKSLAEKKR